jgi:hypothetical protein
MGLIEINLCAEETKALSQRARRPFASRIYNHCSSSCGRSSGAGRRSLGPVPGGGRRPNMRSVVYRRGLIVVWTSSGCRGGWGATYCNARPHRRQKIRVMEMDVRIGVCPPRRRHNTRFI